MPFLPPNQQCQSTEGTDVCTCAIIIDSGGSGVKEGVVRQGVWEMEGLCPLGVQGQSPPYEVVGQVLQELVIFCKLYYSDVIWKKAKQYL